MNIEWIRKDTKSGKILLVSKIEEDDPREEIWNSNEEEIKQDGFHKRYNDFNGNDYYEFQYWINKESVDEVAAILEFNQKCKKWNLGSLPINNQSLKNLLIKLNKNLEENLKMMELIKNSLSEINLNDE